MLQDGQFKETTLDDNATIYTQRAEKTEKQKLSEMTSKEKFEYLKTYYLSKTIIAIIVIAFIGYLAYSIMAPTSETVLYGAVINYALSEETAESVQNDFADYLNLNPNESNILLDTSFYLGTNDDMSQYTMSAQQKLSTYIFASEIDIIIAPESVMSTYASIGYLEKLTDILPTDLNNELKDSMYHTTSSEDPIRSAYGVYIDSSNVYEPIGTETDRPVLAVLANSSYKDNAVDFIRYIFEIKE